MAKQLRVEEEANQRGLPVEVIELERRMNEALHQPDLLRRVDEELGRQGTKIARPRRLNSGQHHQRR